MKRPRGFTMVELIVVISIITILIGLLIVGIGHLHNAARRQQTQQVFNNLQGMFAEWNAVTRVPFSSWVMPCPMNVSTGVNLVPQMSAVADDINSVGNRYGAAVWIMRDLMFNLKSTPNNAAAMAKMPADEIMVMPDVYNGSAGFPTGFSTPPAWTQGNAYQPTSTPGGYKLTRVYINDSATGLNSYYDCIQPMAQGSTASETLPASEAAYWLQAYPTFNGTTPSDNSMPIPLDAWGNPIIFVPGGALGSGVALGGSMGTNSPVTPGSGALVAGGVTTTVRSPDGRPFFASAGPDGDFSQGDDNLYSFEH